MSFVQQLPKKRYSINRALKRRHLQGPRLARERAEKILQVEAAERQRALENEQAYLAMEAHRQLLEEEEKEGKREDANRFKLHKIDMLPAQSIWSRLLNNQYRGMKSDYKTEPLHQDPYHLLCPSCGRLPAIIPHDPVSQNEYVFIIINYIHFNCIKKLLLIDYFSKIFSKRIRASFFVAMQPSEHDPHALELRCLNLRC